MRLALLYPVWDRPCSVCEKYRVDEAPDRRTGLPMLRESGMPTPCGSCAKVPANLRPLMGWKELRKYAVEVTEESRAAWDFYRRCRAVGSFPDDPIVHWTAVICRDVVDEVARQPLEKLTAAVDRLVDSLPARRR